MPSVGQQDARLPSQSRRSGRPEPTLHPAPAAPTIGPLPSAPATDPPPAVLRPVDEKQHGQYRQANHAVVTTAFDYRALAGPKLPPGDGPQGIDGAIADAFFKIVTSSPDEQSLKANLDQFARLVKSKDPDSFLSGAVTGACARCAQMMSSLGQMGCSHGEVALVMATVVGVVAAQAVPVLAAPLNLTLFLVGGSTALAESKAAWAQWQTGNSFESGRHAGSAAVEGILAASSGFAALKAAKSLPGALQLQSRLQACLANIKGAWGYQWATAVADKVNSVLSPLANAAPVVAATKATQGASKAARLLRPLKTGAESMDGAQSIRQLVPSQQTTDQTRTRPVPVTMHTTTPKVTMHAAKFLPQRPAVPQATPSPPRPPQTQAKPTAMPAGSLARQSVISHRP